MEVALVGVGMEALRPRAGLRYDRARHQRARLACGEPACERQPALVRVYRLPVEAEDHRQ